MAVANRLVGSCRALQSDHHLPSSSSSSSSASPLSLTFSWTARPKRKMVAATAVVSPQKQHKPSSGPFGIIDITTLVTQLAKTAKEQCWRLKAEILIERGVIGCQSFTLIAVAGSLVGSILCFVEGCFFVLESFYQYFKTISQRVEDHGEIIELLIEALDMFLVGTATVTFGMGLYVMFAGSDLIKQRKGWLIAESNFFGLFNLKRLPESMQMQSIAEAKSKIGHAVLLILQAGVMDKFKNVPLTSPLDLACFAGAVLISAASVFLLSRLSAQQKQSACI